MKLQPPQKRYWNFSIVLWLLGLIITILGISINATIYTTIGVVALAVGGIILILACVKGSL